MKHSAKWVRTNVENLQKHGYDIGAEFENGGVRFTTALGKNFTEAEWSRPMTVEQAKFFLFGYHARCGK